MKVRKISLNERLKQLSNGYPSDPEFVTSAIHSFADIPIGAYLYDYPEELEILTKQIIGTTKEEMARLSYKDVASRIYQVSHMERRSRALQKAIEILSLPLRKHHDKKKYVYGGS